ncbi:MAG TPA: YihY family inner membrane protein [Sulfuricella sp.]|nr:YihY family inner membrane protein [Sulfuricella sp.]
MVKNFSRLTRFLRFVWQWFEDAHCIQFAASLTYTTLLALVPIITIALTIFSAFPVFADLMVQLKIFILSNFVPASAGKIIAVYMQQFSEKAANLTALGILLLGAAAFILMLTIYHAFNVIWRVRRPRSLLHRFFIHFMALTLGPLLIGASLSLTSYLISVPLGLVKGAPLISVAILKMVPVVLTIIAFSLLYQFVPNCTVRPRHALIGGVAAGFVFELMKKGFALYVTHVHTYALVYGAFASIPIFLLWIYLSWLVVLSGAVIAAAIPYWDVAIRQVEETAGQGFFAALAILLALDEARQSGGPLSLQRLQHESGLGPEYVEDILDRLNTLRWAGKIAHGGWVLTRNADAVRLADVYREFVFNPEKARAGYSPGNGQVATLMAKLDAGLDEALGLSLREFSGRG